MPIRYERIVYGCAFKCSQKYNQSLKFIEGHEKRCWRNPDTRTCLTCQRGKKCVEVEHSDYDSGNPGYRFEWWECDGEEVSNGQQPAPPVVNCNMWLPKKSDQL